MKWGKVLQRRVDAEPDWAPYFVNYKKLKAVVRDVAAAAALRDGADDGVKASADPLRLGTSVTPDLREPWARAGDPRVAPAMYASPNLGESLGTMDTLPTMTPPLMQQTYYPPGFYSPIPVSREGVNTATPPYWASVGGGRRQHPLPQEVSMTSPLLRQPEVVMRSETGRSFQSPMPSPALVGPPGFAATPTPAAAAAAVADAPDLFPGVNPTAGLTPHQAMYYPFPHSFHPMYQSQMMQQYSMSRLSGGAPMALHAMPFPAMPAGQGAKGQSPSAQDGHGGGSTATGHPPGVAAGAPAAAAASAAAAVERLDGIATATKTEETATTGAVAADASRRAAAQKKCGGRPQRWRQRRKRRRRHSNGLVVATTGGRPERRGR